MCEFRIGQKVVCVLGGHANLTPQETSPPLIAGEVYTIRSVSLSSFVVPAGVLHKVPSVRLVGHVRTFNNGDCRDYPFIAARFRPLADAERHYDISIFRAMCVDATKRVSAE